MTNDEAFTHGFVKRAMEEGYTQTDGLALLRAARERAMRAEQGPQFNPVFSRLGGIGRVAQGLQDRLADSHYNGEREQVYL